MPRPKKLDPLEYHNLLLESIKAGTLTNDILANFIDYSCFVNYKGVILKSHIVGYSAKKPDNKFLIYSKQIEDGIYGDEYPTVRGCPIKGMYNSHVWGSPCIDPNDFTRINTFLVASIGRRLIDRSYSLYGIDIAVRYALLKKINILHSEESDYSVNDFLFDTYVGEKPDSNNQNIRQLELDDE